LGSKLRKPGKKGGTYDAFGKRQKPTTVSQLEEGVDFKGGEKKFSVTEGTTARISEKTSRKKAKTTGRKIRRGGGKVFGDVNRGESTGEGRKNARWKGIRRF